MLACRLRMQGEQFQQGIDLLFEIAALHPAQSSDQLQIFPPGQVRIEMSFFRNIAEALPVSRKIVLNVVTVELHDAARRLQQSGEHLHGRALAGTVRAEASQHLSGPQARTTNPAPPATMRSAWSGARLRAWPPREMKASDVERRENPSNGCLDTDGGRDTFPEMLLHAVPPASSGRALVTVTSSSLAFVSRFVTTPKLPE